MTAIRCDFLICPGIGFHEHRTSVLVADLLESRTLARGICGSGFVGMLK
jgi:metal-dependent amidase/aminoacylase/carboxypeptidase family protein